MTSMEANHPTTHPALGRRRRRRLVATATLLAGATLASTGLALIPAEPASAEFFLSSTTRLVSRTNAGGVVPGYVDDVALSGNGRFAAFVTSAALVPEDTNGKVDVYVRDRWAAVTELVSMTDAEQPLNAASDLPSLSDDGRYVSFLTDASNLIPGDDAASADAFVRDRYAGTTTRVAPGIGGALLTHKISQLQMAGGGRYVVFSTQASNVVPNDSNGWTDAFVRDLQTGTIERVSLTAVDGQANGITSNPSISDDGRYVAFDNGAQIAGGVVGGQNVYLRDRTAGTTQLVNVTSEETLPDAGAASPSISGNGRFVVFSSAATNLVAGDGNGAYDLFVRDLVGGTTERVSLPDGTGELATGGSTVPLGVDDDASHILFSTGSKANAAADAGTDQDVFMRTRENGRTVRITSSTLVPDPASNSFFASIDDTGRSVGFRITQKMTSDGAFDQAYVKGGVPAGPLPSVAQTTERLHQDFLGRGATPAEETAWTNLVNSGQADTATLVAKLAADPAYADSRAPMIRLYWAFLVRRPDSSGLTFWLKRYQAGTKLSTIAQSFATSSEFTNRYGNVGNQQYVKLVFENVFERQPDPSGLSYWTGKLDRKEVTRGGVIVGFSESSEGKRRLAGPTNITLMTLAMLGSTPDAALWNQLYPTIDAGEKQAAWIGRQLLASSAYAAKVA
jgi:Tol biopolymer transport system component